uniref:Uncharacterized protein n=1 Tax=Lepeophtheirus salmonis TaxID=72036 RepID=A0A0K2UIF2_LEPSM
MSRLEKEPRYLLSIRAPNAKDHFWTRYLVWYTLWTSSFVSTNQWSFQWL